MRFLISLVVFFVSFSIQAMQITEIKMAEPAQAKWLSLIYPHGKVFQSNDERIRPESELDNGFFEPGDKTRIFWKIPKNLIKDTETIEDGPANHVLVKFERAFRIQDENKTYLFIVVNTTQIGNDLQDTLMPKSCASCDGMMGIATIDVTNPTPSVIKSTPFFVQMGHRGQIPENITAVKIGPDKEILLLKRQAGFINASDQVMALVDPKKHEILFLKKIQSCLMGGDEKDDDWCGEEKLDSQVRILEKMAPKNGYYLLDMHTKGKFYDSKSKKTVHYTKDEQYFFNGTEYQLLKKSK